MNHIDTDVVVVGAGLAGISAALAACAQGADVTLVTDGSLCGGSSFSANTWGLGMVSESPDDAQKRGPESLFKALERVGMGVNTSVLSQRLIDDGPEAISWLATQGAMLSVPKDASQREFVPCFDERVREWHGFLAADSRQPLAAALATSGVRVIEQFAFMRLLRSGDVVAGVLGLHKMCEVLEVRAKATILATGGTAGLYKRHICPSTCANGHFEALLAGAGIINAEFMQLMVGCLSPLNGTVFNEKLWRWVHLSLETGEDAADVAGKLGEPCSLEDALEAHSWHGPFTFERQSRLVERLIMVRPAGAVRAQIPMPGPDEEPPELIRTYCDWLRDVRHVDPWQPLPLTLFAHSSNGGIVIDENGRTSVKGLYACGEAAGGVHGADRIGGLASVSAVVFGRRAGLAAASADLAGCQAHRVPAELRHVGPEAVKLMQEMASALDAHALAARTHEGLAVAREVALSGLERLDATSHPVMCEGADLSAQEAQGALRWCQARAALTVSLAMVDAMDARTESRGSHWREDFPCKDASQAHAHVVTLDDQGLPQVWTA